MGQAQTQNQQSSTQQPLNQHELLLINSITYYLFKDANTIPMKLHQLPQQVQFSINCPRCKSPQFDDGLGRTVSCYNCQLIYSVEDGIPQIKEDLNSVDERRMNLQKDFNFVPLEKLILQTNKSKLPSELIANGKVNYKKIIHNVIIPFFSIRQRVITIGVQFNIGYFEFKVVGGYPLQGIVDPKTEIYCYQTYLEEPLGYIKLYSQKRSNQIEQEVKGYMMNNPKCNQVIEDIHLKVNNNELLVLQCDNGSGKISNLSRIECVNNVSRLKDAKFCVISMPMEFRQLPQNEDQAKKAIEKYIVAPYFLGMTRYLQKGQFLHISEFEFQVYFEEESGLVIPYQTQFEVTIGTWRPIRAPRIARPTQSVSSTLFQTRRGELNRVHAQQIEALHRLLSTFVLMSENPQLFNLNGATSEMINNLPIRQIDLEFIRNKKFDEDHVRCMICLEDYVDKDEVRTMPCWHYFHVACLDKWLAKKNGCPICKTEIE